MEIIKNEENGNIKITILEKGKEIAKARCYYKKTPIIYGKNIGTIGDIEIINKEHGKKLLSECEKIFKEKGIHTIIAPMNGNTWKK